MRKFLKVMKAILLHAQHAQFLIHQKEKELSEEGSIDNKVSTNDLDDKKVEFLTKQKMENFTEDIE